MKSRCDTCQWSHAPIAASANDAPVNGNQAMQCRRHPPTAFALLVPGQPTMQGPSLAVQGLTLWPSIAAVDFCGDHQPYE